MPTLPIFFSQLNFTSSTKILDVKDDESNPITLSAQLLVSGFSYPLPSYLSILGNTIISTPTQLSDVGLHLLRLKISDGGGLFSTMNLLLNVTNSAPYFTSPPNNQTVKLNNTLSFSLPPKKDDENNLIT